MGAKIESFIKENLHTRSDDSSAESANGSGRKTEGIVELEKVNIQHQETQNRTLTVGKKFDERDFCLVYGFPNKRTVSLFNVRRQD